MMKLKKNQLEKGEKKSRVNLVKLNFQSTNIKK